ncbi:FmdE family protein [Methanobrevibacter sp.]|uniref:FmdE family protein n=1 Tax=Methanobrevibacter sp. TaxID=66852 RepID=UPI0025D53FC7|nr:FmdE family protein [Methanobrevibacter sp.]MBQ2832223.1 hypothetical protein [Methanobrevibacter sp.]
MKKHSVVIVMLLILALSLVTAVSASEDIAGQTEDSSAVISDSQLGVADDASHDNVGTSISVYSANSAVDDKLQGDSNYQLGYNVTMAADKKLNFKSADDVLVITTAGLTRINNVTTENVLNGILDAADGYVSLGKGNLLTLSAIRTDPTNIAFIVKNGDKLTMAFYKNGETTPLYYGNAGPELSAKEWKKLQQLLGNDDAYSYISIANSWANGISKDILMQATYHGHVCTGLISGQAMIQTLLKYYPPRGESGLPLENTAYYVIGVPGDSDDDAFTWTMDITPGKRAYIGVDTMVDKSMTGFIRWNSTSNTGLIVIMSYDEAKIKETFKSKTGLNPDASATNDLKYQNWLIKTLQDNPTSLVDVLYELDGLSEDDLYYIMGQEVGKGNVIKSAHGLDMDYILNLSLKKATREEQDAKQVTQLTPEQFKQIGVDASNMALDYFKSQGVVVEKDSPNLFALTSASYVRVNGTSSEMVLDGITEVLGSRLSKKTLLPVHASLWKDLVFDFYWINSTNNKDTLSYSLAYDVSTGKLIETGNTTGTANYVIQNVLAYDPPYDVLVAWLFHNHVCGGSSPGYLITDFIYDELPITNENESYIYITTDDNCKDDIISRLLGVSPGMENYYNLRYNLTYTNGTNVGIAIKWNSATNTGEAMIVYCEWPSFAKGSNSYEEYIRLYKGDTSSPNIVKMPVLKATAKKEIDSDMLSQIVAGATETEQGNSIAYIMSLDDKLPERPAQSTDNTQSQDDSENTNSDVVVDGGSSSNSQNGGSSTSGRSAVGRSSSALARATSAASAASADSSDSPSDDDSSDSDAYEISEKPAAKSADNAILVAIAAVCILGAILGYGYLKRKD